MLTDTTTFIAERMLSGLPFEVNPDDYERIVVKSQYEDCYVLRLVKSAGNVEDVTVDELPVGIWFSKEE